MEVFLMLYLATHAPQPTEAKLAEAPQMTAPIDLDGTPLHIDRTSL